MLVISTQYKIGVGITPTCEYRISIDMLRNITDWNNKEENISMEILNIVANIICQPFQYCGP